MRLLMVEDDPTIASFLVKGLQEAGYAVAPAAHHQVPTLHRQHRLFCASSDSSSSAPTLLRQFRLFIVSTDSDAQRPAAGFQAANIQIAPDSATTTGMIRTAFDSPT